VAASRLSAFLRHPPLLQDLRAPYHLTWLTLAQLAGLVDRFECGSEIVGERVGGGDELWAGLDLDRTVAAGRLDELPDRPSGCRLDPAGDGERGEDDRQVGLDGVALVVVNGAGLEV